MITLFEKDQNCCGCSACVNICPKNAITMKENKYGFIHPSIDTNLCIECGLCKKVCNFQNRENYSNEHTAYAAVTKDEKILMKSTSGGVFATLAKAFLEDGGYIAGAIYDENFDVKHIVSNKYEDLLKMQGSKYVQSDTSKVYCEVKKLLTKGEKVLFSGTPCQVDGLYGYLMKNYDNLYTIDIVCHGVPSNKMFKDYLDLENIDKDAICKFKFRDKEQGWDKSGTIRFKNNKFKKINSGNSLYYYLFNESVSFRDSCYSCKYASIQRVADITIGDYWGIEIMDANLLIDKKFDINLGISLTIVNSVKGEKILNEFGNNLDIYKTELYKLCKFNHNLNKASIKPDFRKVIFEIYSEKSLEEVSRSLDFKMKKERIKLTVKKMLPVQLKRIIKSIRNRK